MHMRVHHLHYTISPWEENRNTPIYSAGWKPEHWEKQGKQVHVALRIKFSSRQIKQASTLFFFFNKFDFFVLCPCNIICFGEDKSYCNTNHMLIETLRNPVSMTTISAPPILESHQ